ncbi:hypothetical protein [Clostridium grantii]|uniref:DUF1643 domain-containing protein n=1 Tax=Clostridium grantii DSM 8605 TaxID=1121316 RepID=A0A1M5U8Q7_9CLOT|nr:hypothetical protein [Clostridium grantii]SHH59364.1 hypothetical protein SAMN02745207_01644 [Clostridium grantii DSM 8605]
MEFIQEKQLDKEFITFGRFYEVKYNNGEPQKCRSILEIRKRSCKDKLADTDNIDAVFVMMNPGGSKPKDEYIQKIKRTKEIELGKLLEIELVETIPDKTQYQLMRIMKHKDWKYVKVINLSDLREAKSKLFYDKVKNIEGFDKDYIHSIFSEKRKKELNSIFTTYKFYNVVVAWGVNTKLTNLIKLAMGSNKLNNSVGYNKSTDKRKVNFYYYHPLPRGIKKQKLWINEIIDKL